MFTEKQQSALKQEVVTWIEQNTIANPNSIQIEVGIWDLINNKHIMASNNLKWMEEYNKLELDQEQYKTLEPWNGYTNPENNFVLLKLEKFTGIKCKYYVINKITPYGYEEIIATHHNSIDSDLIEIIESNAKTLINKLKEVAIDWKIPNIKNKNELTKIYKKQLSNMINGISYLKLENNFIFNSLEISRNEMLFLNKLINNKNIKKKLNKEEEDINMFSAKLSMFDKTKSFDITSMLNKIKKTEIFQYIRESNQKSKNSIYYQKKQESLEFNKESKLIKMSS